MMTPMVVVGNNDLMSSLTKMIAEQVVKKCAREYGFNAEEALKLLQVKVSEPSSETVKESRKVKSKGERKVKKEKKLFALPYSGEVCEENCNAVRYNSGLYTQCEKKKKEGSEYCSGCENECSKSETGMPEFGTMEMRMKVGIMDYVDPRGRKPVAYRKYMKKRGLTKEAVISEGECQGVSIAEVHFEEVGVGGVSGKRGRPMKEKVEKEKKEKGRKKKETVVELEEEEDLFATIIEESCDSDAESEDLVEAEESDEEIEVVLKPVEVVEAVLKPVEVVLKPVEVVESVLKPVEVVESVVVATESEVVTKSSKKPKIAADFEAKLAAEKAAKAKKIAEEKAKKAEDDKAKEEKEKKAKKEEEKAEKAKKAEEEKAAKAKKQAEEKAEKAKKAEEKAAKAKKAEEEKAAKAKKAEEKAAKSKKQVKTTVKEQDTPPRKTTPLSEETIERRRRIAAGEESEEEQEDESVATLQEDEEAEDQDDESIATLQEDEEEPEEDDEQEEQEEPEEDDEQEEQEEPEVKPEVKEEYQEEPKNATWKVVKDKDKQKYLRSLSTNLLYDYAKYTESDGKIKTVVGKWDLKIDGIVLNKICDDELSEEEIDD